MSDNPAIHPFDSAYIWHLTVRPSPGLNGFWLVHKCGDLQNPPLNVVGAENFPAQTQIQTQSKHNDGWSICFLDEYNSLWVATDWMAGSSSGDYNLPDLAGEINITVDTTNGDVSFQCSYVDDNKEKIKDFTINKAKLFTSLD